MTAEVFKSRFRDTLENDFVWDLLGFLDMPKIPVSVFYPADHVAKEPTFPNNLVVNLFVQRQTWPRSCDLSEKSIL